MLSLISSMLDNVAWSGVGEQALVDRFKREYWSPAPKKLVHAAMAELNCADCAQAPVLTKPKHVHWQYILAYGYAILASILCATTPHSVVLLSFVQRLRARAD